MHRAGVVSIGSHTHRHEILTQVSREQARETISRSLTELEAMTGAPCRTFSYPNGDFNPSLIDLLGELKIRCAFTTVKAFWSRRDHPLAIPRIGIGGYDSRDRFAAVVSGLALAR
jgi:peptidoglycan/xylan/chitin deacetylase (PgdA/CDA1 family)